MVLNCNVKDYEKEYLDLRGIQKERLFKLVSLLSKNEIPAIIIFMDVDDTLYRYEVSLNEGVAILSQGDKILLKGKLTKRFVLYILEKLQKLVGIPGIKTSWGFDFPC